MPKKPTYVKPLRGLTPSEISHEKGTVAMTLIWAPTAIAMLVVKYYVVLGPAFERSMTAMGMANVVRWSDLSFFQRLSFWREDLVVAFVLVPMVARAMLNAGRYRVWIAAGLSFALFAPIVIEVANYQTVGRFLGLDLIVDSVRWAIDHPDDMQTYLGMNADRPIFTLRNVYSLVGLLALVGCAGTVAHLLHRRWAVAHADPGRVIRILPLALYAAAVLVAGVSWYPWMKPTPLHSSSLVLATTAIFESKINLSSDYSALTVAELQDRYRRLTFSPIPKPSEYSGKAQGYDVILYVLETAPSKLLPVDGDLSDMPNLSRLRQRAWTNSNHYTTYPISNRAAFSILSSMYPTGGARLFKQGGKSIPGLMQSVHSRGYATAVYMPFAISFASERTMYSMLGADRLVVAAPDQNLPAQVDQSRWHRRAQLDTSALDLMLNDITRWHKENRRYVVTYLPQIAHGPWIDVESGGQETNILKRGRGLLRLQDQSLGRLIESLEKEGRLEKTLIVVTGDHGIRTAGEDPTFHGGALDSYTFCVPIFVFAPGVLNSTASLPWVTSHIDIAPTILELLGIENGRAFEQGSPIWDDRLRVRLTYLLAGEYFGVDGYHQNEMFFEWSPLLSVAYQSSLLTTGSAIPLGAASAEYAGVKSRIQGLISMQIAWFQRAIQ